MRALSFLFAALLGIALAMITPALAGPGVETPMPQVTMAEPVLSEPVAMDAVDPAPELDDSLIVSLGLDELDGSILDGPSFGDAA
jgi:hypothetical protein